MPITAIADDALDLLEASMLGFVATGTSPMWGGKFKCMYCNQKGYVSVTLLDWYLWWGHKHGNNCRRKYDLVHE